jgi:hypothetical protein
MSAIATEGSSKEKNQIILVSIAGIFLSLIFTSLILGIPYYKNIKNNIINNLQLLADNKAIMLSHQLYRYRSQAYSISQRIHPTRLLAKFYRQEISLEEFRHDSARILEEAMS